VVEIAPRDEVHFAASVPGEEIGELAVGMPVKIKLDAFDYQRYGTLDGEVWFISPDSRPSPGAEPAGPLEYQVRIRLSRKEVGRGGVRGEVKLGMAGAAEIITDRQSLLAVFLRKIRRTISLA
jgi:hemolysin D